jgi:2-iminobutanoate/2-iminopropanoate deaminase
MARFVETSTPPNTPAPIGPYSHIAKVGLWITIGGTAGVDPATGELAGPDLFSQTKRILESFRVMLESVGSDLEHVVHVNVFLNDVGDFEEMNRAVGSNDGRAPARENGHWRERSSAQTGSASDDEPDGGGSRVGAGRPEPSRA